MHEVLKTLDSNSWNVEIFGRVIAKFNLEGEIQEGSLEKLSKPQPQKAQIHPKSNKREIIPSNGSLRSRALQLASRRNFEKEQEQARKKAGEELMESQRSVNELVNLFDALISFKDNLKEFPSVIQERISEEILTEAGHGQAFPFEFKLRDDDNYYAAVSRYLGSTNGLVRWFGNTKTLPGE